MIIEYRGIKVDTTRPLKDYDMKLLEEIEKETRVKIPYDGKRIVDSKTGIVKRISVYHNPSVEKTIVDSKTGIIRRITEKLSQDASIIEYKGIRIDISKPLTEGERMLMEEIENVVNLKIQYKGVEPSVDNDDSIIEYKGIRIDISRPLTLNDKKLLKQMEREIKEKETKYFNDKNVSIMRRNGINWIYENENNNLNIEDYEARINKSSQIVVNNKELFEQMRKEGKVKKDNLGREMLWNGKAWVLVSIIDYQYESESNQHSNEDQSQSYSTDSIDFDI
ncbi:hypothetical protein [Candidatus Nitrosocosmicus arcticus]|uniref:Uncharacterized protein n=1 Tax=Candidatus Nitrosocosmicus arcticus TaxID=2035267 RepID=A0A557SVY2_9ARCH|nr:hypothetical protein [Candidatus Nitrosocosmicus arcticus]TVP40760.1 hypothetical protein NARC_60147 [Candidatus Nitrosocosmicus arcticus]